MYFQDKWANVSNNVNDIWETWKYIVNTAAESVARKVPKVKNYNNFWDKGLDKILKRRREANRLQRLHNKTRPYDSELGKQLSALYQKRKKQLHDAIVNKQVNNKINFFNDKCVGGKNESKMFWNMLKGPRVTINPSQIIDPVSKTVIFEEKVEIETSVNILLKLVQT